MSCTNLCRKPIGSRQEVKDVKNAMVHALQTVDTNHASHVQIIQAQAQYLQRLTAKQDSMTNAMQALSDANVRLNEVNASAGKRI